MIDWFVLLAPICLLAVVALLGFVGCDIVLGLNPLSPVTPTPTFDPLPGNYGAAKPVTLSDTDSSATIYYTTDQSTPVVPPPMTLPTGPTQLYSSGSPITVATSTVINAIASSPGKDNSAVATGVYFISRIMFQPNPAENSETTNSLTVTTAQFDHTTMAGDLILVWIFYHSLAQTVAGVTDTEGNTYAGPVVGPTQGAGNLAGWQQETGMRKTSTGNKAHSNGHLFIDAGHRLREAH